VALRSGHGTGAGSPRIEVLPPDELPFATPTITAPIERSQDGRFAPGNTVARAKRVRPGVRGSLGLSKTDPRYTAFARWGARYGAHRRRELASAHGGTLSAGASAIIESAAQAMAASRFVQALAAETGDPELFKQAAALASTARQHELAAWELAAREAQARPRGKSLADLIAEQADAKLAAQRAAGGGQ
jgi:hypothetical protein